MDYEVWMARLREKLNLSRFPDIDPKFAQLTRAILEPRRDLWIDPEGFIFDADGGFWGTREGLVEWWQGFTSSPQAGLTEADHQEAQSFLKSLLNYWRCEAPDKKPYMDKFCQTITLALEVTEDPRELAELVGEIMSPKARKAQGN